MTSHHHQVKYQGIKRAFDHRDTPPFEFSHEGGGAGLPRRLPSYGTCHLG